jgi:hypothetical protein
MLTIALGSAMLQAAYDVLLFCLCGAVGQLFIFATIKRFGSLLNTLVTTTRKFFNILLSGAPLSMLPSCAAHALCVVPAEIFPSIACALKLVLLPPCSDVERQPVVAAAMGSCAAGVHGAAGVVVD